MTDELKEEIKIDPAASAGVQPEGEKKPEGTQDPLQTELETVQKKGKTKLEKLLFKKKEIDRQLRDEGIDPAVEAVDEDDEKPVTVGMLKQIQAQNATKTALELAEAITNPVERELTKHYLENNIKPSGDPQEDFRLAQGLVNAAKNKQILEEANRKGQPNNASSGGGAPAGQNTGPVVEFTPAELVFMQPPYNLSKEQVLEARKKA